MIKKLAFPRTQLNFDYTFNGGQAFRWQKTADNKWIGVFAHRIWTLWQEGDSIFYKVIKGEHVKDTQDEDTLLKNYFRLEEPLSDLYHKWSKSDPIFEEASKKFEGVRMLRQDPIENIFTFICSSNNNISRIKSMVEKLCTFYGNKIAEVDGVVFYDFPDVKKLAEPSVSGDLQKAAFGYRAKFIQQAACSIVQFGGQNWIDHLRKLPYKETKAELIKLSGIGAKVADCICLMSFDHLEAIPVDTHVFQIASKYYLPHLKGVKSVTDRIYNEIGDHFRSLYGEYAGWAHCVLFCGELKIFQDETDGKRKKMQNKEGTKKSKK